MNHLRLVMGLEEKRQRRRGRRATDAPEDVAGRMAVATIAFWFGILLGSQMSGGFWP